MLDSYVKQHVVNLQTIYTHIVKTPQQPSDVVNKYSTLYSVE